MPLSLVALVLTSLPPTPLVLPSEGATRGAEAMVDQGQAALQRSEFGAALYFFAAADAQLPTPAAARGAARAYQSLGDAAFAVAALRTYMRRAPNAPDTLEAAEWVGEALSQAELDGRGFLEVFAPRARSLTIGATRFVEGPGALFLPPGEYDVQAEFPSGPKRMVAQVRTGKISSVTFEPLPPPMVSSFDGGDAVRVDASVPTPVPRVRLAAWAVTGLAIVAASTGAVLGALSTGDATRAQQRTLTVREAQDSAAAANEKGLGANVLFGVAGAAALAGGGLFFWSASPAPPGAGGGAPRP